MPVYLVTGGAGFIGSSLASALLHRGETVRVLDDLSSGRKQNLETLKGRLEVTIGSICDPDIVRRAMDGVDAVLHQAAIPSVVVSVEDPAATMQANVQGTTLVLEAARRAGVKRIVFASSCAIYGDAPEFPKQERQPPRTLSPYAVSKLAGEHLMQAFAALHGLETLSLRYFNIFGARQDPTSQYAAVIPAFVSAALRGARPVVYGDGEQTRDFCHVDNVVAANLLGLEARQKLSGQVVNIGCGAETSLNELLRLVGEEVGRPVVAEHQAERPGDIRRSVADIGEARRLLGYEPKVGVREGLKRTIAALRS